MNRRRLIIIAAAVLVITGALIFFVSRQSGETKTTPANTKTLTEEDRILEAVKSDTGTKSYGLTPTSVSTVGTYGQWLNTRVVFKDKLDAEFTYTVILYKDTYDTLNVVASVDDPMTPDNLRLLSVPDSVISDVMNSDTIPPEQRNDEDNIYD